MKIEEKNIENTEVTTPVTSNTGNSTKIKLISSVEKYLHSRGRSLNLSNIKIKRENTESKPQFKTLKPSILAKSYKATPDKIKFLQSLLEKFLNDLSRRGQQLQIESGKGLVPLINQLDVKWRSFAGRVGTVDKDGFLYVLEKRKQPLWKLYSSMTGKSSVVQKIDAKRKFKNNG